MTEQPAPRLLGLPEVKRVTSFSEATLRRRVKDGSFPKPLQIGPNRVAWLEQEVASWIGGLERAI